MANTLFENDALERHQIDRGLHVSGFDPNNLVIVAGMPRCGTTT
ncbi:MAG: hypothetical protein ACKVK8_09605 [Rhodospirillales bacterium]